MLTLTEAGRLTLGLGQSSLSGAPDKSPIARDVSLARENELFLAVDGTSVECAVNGQWLSGRAYPTQADAGGLAVEGAGLLQARMGVARE